MGIDIGKEGKRKGSMSLQQARHTDQDPARVPPHKKPRKYRLTVQYTRTFTETCVKDFPSKAAMVEFASRVRREIAKEKAAQPRRFSRLWGKWWSTDLKMESTERRAFEGEPTVTGEMIDD